MAEITADHKTIEEWVAKHKGKPATVKILSPEATIKDAARQMRHGDFGLMPAGEDGRLV